MEESEEDKATEKRHNHQRRESFQIQFFRAPCRRAPNKGWAYYVVIGLVCAIFLLVVGLALVFFHLDVYKAINKNAAENSVFFVGLPVKFLGPVFVSLGGIIVVFTLALLLQLVWIRWERSMRRQQADPPYDIIK